MEFQKQELQKELLHRRELVQISETRCRVLEEQLTRANEFAGEMEEQAARESEAATLAKARVDDLLKEIDYLKEQVKIYQQRLGLLPQERQGTSDKGPPTPIRKAREPFEVLQARVQAERKEEYWRQRAAAVESGVTGTTTEAAVSDTGE